MDENNKVESLEDVTIEPTVKNESVTENLTTEPVTPVVEPVVEIPASTEVVSETQAPAEIVIEAPTEAEPVTEAAVTAEKVPTTEPVTTPVEPTTEEKIQEEVPTKEEKKKSKSSTVIFVLLILVVVIFAVWFFALGGNEMLGFKKAEETPSQEEEKKEEPEKTEEVQLSDEEYKKLIGYIPFEYRYESKNDTYSPFDSKKITVKEMDTNWLVEKAMSYVTEKGDCTEEQFQLNGICNYTISKENVLKAFKELYGDIGIEIPTVVNLNPLNNTCTLDTNNIYACGMEGGTTTTMVLNFFNLPGTRFFTRFVKAEKDSKNLYVYAKYAKIEYVYDEANNSVQPGDITFRIRKYGTGNEVIDETVLNGADYYEEYDSNVESPFYDKLYEQFKDKITTYKITYKITGNNSYNLVSIEPVK